MVIRVRDKFLITYSFVQTPRQGRRDHPNDTHPEGLAPAGKLLFGHYYKFKVVDQC